MICNKCGKELPDDSRFCEYCGAQVDEKVIKQIENEKKAQQQAENKEKMQQTLTEVKDKVVDMAQDVHEKSKVATEVVKESAQGLKEKSKTVNKKPFIIGGIIVAVVAAIVLAITLFVGRSVDKTMDSMAKAYAEQDDEKLMKYMFPSKAIEDIEDALKEKDIDIYEEFEKVFGKNTDISDYKIVGEEEVDEVLEKDIEELLDTAKLDLEYDSVKILVLSLNGNEEDAVKLLTYKVGNKWYIVPGVLEYIVETRQKDDIRTAESIETAIQTSLSSELAYEGMEPYWGVVISLDDIEYLPEGFRNEFSIAIKDEDISLRHTEDGATGYAFRITTDWNIEVYISSDTKMDEWRVCPEVDSDYYKGIKDEVSGTALSSEYSYVKLISEQSPIMGYWQSDKVGMYIGYNVSGGDEGFTVYLQSQDVDFQLLHGYEGYTYSGGAGNIRLSKDASDYTAIYDIQVVDNDTIKLIITDGRYNIDANTEFTFKRAEITKETLSEFEDTWICGGELFGMGSYGYAIDLVYCTECSSIHKKDHEDTEGESYHSNRHVALYDGKTLHYIFPQNGLLSDFEGWTNYNGVNYKIEGNTLYEEVYGHNGGGGAADCTYFREDSEQAQVAEALNAYQEYANNDSFLSENTRNIALFYLNDDNIPEAIVTDATSGRQRGYLMTYSDGNVETLWLECAYDVMYQERQSKICVPTSPAGGHYGYSFYSVEHGKFVETDSFFVYEDYGTEAGIKYHVGSDEVNEDMYNSKFEEAKQNFGVDSAIYVTGYSSWRDAYNDLKKPIDTSKYDTGSSVVVEEGDTIWVSVESSYSGAGGDSDWESQGESELVVSVDTYEFDQTDTGLSDDEKQANVNKAVGKKVGEYFELTFQYGDGARTYRYTILGIKKN